MGEIYAIHIMAVSWKYKGFSKSIKKFILIENDPKTWTSIPQQKYWNAQ